MKIYISFLQVGMFNRFLYDTITIVIYCQYIKSIEGGRGGNKKRASAAQLRITKVTGSPYQGHKQKTLKGSILRS